MAADALVSQFVEILASMAKEEVTMLLGAEDALQQLEEDVRAFSGALQDAERRAFTDTSIRRWLADVKDLVYDADDIIDCSRTHAEKLARLYSSEHPVLCYNPILLFFRKIALRHRTGNSIRSVNVRIERIRKKESGLNLNLMIAATAAIRGDHDHRGSSSSTRIERQTGPLLEPNIVGSGIDNDTSSLVGLLTREEEEYGDQRIPVVAITGMGGVGKTTLAQKIYNHKTIKDCFREPPQMWLCVSQQYTNEKLLKEIIRYAGVDPERDESFAELQIRLARVIEGKKLFLILDDIWDAKVWMDLLQNPLQSCAAGSRVLISTRQQSVARQMGAIHLHPVHPLTDEESWSLLCKLVFLEDRGVGVGGEVKEIGRQIAKKCGGLPLAIKTIAGVLMKKSMNCREWEMVLTNPAWSLEDLPDRVMGVLYMSYQDLPFGLKQCFIFCSLFPEDSIIRRDGLTRLWVAEGYIAARGDVLLEDVADEYYQELITRSLLQPYYPQVEDEDENERCKMHDLLRSLAQFLAGDEYGDVSQLVNATNTSSSSSSSSSTSLMKRRHLWIVDTTHDAFTKIVKKHESLRTLFIYCRKYPDDTTNLLFNELGFLRVLGYPYVKSLPKCVGNLIHLRYLYLSRSSIVDLPETVGNLINLQYLILYYCTNLKELPRGIAKLYKLRFLELDGCPVDGLPAGIGRLQHLNCLKGFVTKEEDNEDGGWCSLEELRSLSQLRTLTIFNLERALRGQPRDRHFLLKHLCHLRHLKLECSFDYQPDGDDEKQNIQLIFEVDLFPPPSLETFKIDGYFGLKFPSWHLPKLTRLELEDCTYLKQLPALGQLPNLTKLSINRASSVESIGPEFMGMGVVALAFPMLTTLNLRDMDNLIEWQWEAEDGVVAMPRLKVLKLKKCPKLRSLPGGLGSVTTLSIKYADSLGVIENIDSLQVLKVKWSKNLARVSNLPALQDIKVINCPALMEVDGLYSLQSLHTGSYDDEMQSLPGWLLLKQGQPAFPRLWSLRIEVVGNDKVLRRCLVDGADWHKIQHYPQVEVDITTDYIPLFLRYTKDPFTLTTNLKADGSAGDDGATADPEN